MLVFSSGGRPRITPELSSVPFDPCWSRRSCVWFGIVVLGVGRGYNSGLSFAWRKTRWEDPLHFFLVSHCQRRKPWQRARWTLQVYERGGTVDLLSQANRTNMIGPSLSSTANYNWIMPTPPPSATEMMVGIPDLQGPSTGAGKDYDAESRTWSQSNIKKRFHFLMVKAGHHWYHSRRRRIRNKYVD